MRVKEDYRSVSTRILNYACVYVCVRGRERERKCVFVCVCVYESQCSIEPKSESEQLRKENEKGGEAW